MAFCKRLMLRYNGKMVKYLFCLLLPFVLCPLAISPLKESKCAYVILLVATYWLLEPVPIAATALLPVVLFPTLGIMNSADVCSNYMKESFMMFIGGLIVAIAVENCMLHERIALKVLLLIGTEIKWLMMGFMAVTMFLSMWISNTATTAMMVPIVEAIVGEMTLDADPEDGMPMSDINEESSTESRERVENTGDHDSSEIQVKSEVSAAGSNTIKIALLLSVCYSANIGGTGTLTGTGPNLAFKGLLEELHPDCDDITFASWMMYNVPGMVICVLIGWFYLYLVYIRCSKTPQQFEAKDSIREIISKRYLKLGSVSFHEGSVIVLFLTLVLLWTFRDPKFISGWADVISSDVKVGDSVPAIAVAFLLFLIPSDPHHLTTSPPLLDWRTAQAKLPWGIIILVGGGFALADAAKVSGLSVMLGNALSSLDVLSPGVMALVICFMTAMLTEVVTNTTTATILLPVFNQMALTMGINPLFLMLPVTVTCSYAFMLPVATPPNAIAFESGHMRTLDMAKPGIVMNIVCCCVQLFMLHTLGVAMFDLNSFPDWANETGLGQARGHPSNSTDFLLFINASQPISINDTRFL